MAGKAERTKMLIGCADGISIAGLQRQIGRSRPMIYNCIDKAPTVGVQMGLKDTHEPEISDETRAWVAGIACIKPIRVHHRSVCTG